MSFLTKNNYKSLFILLFTAFGFTIALIGFILNLNVQSEMTKSEVERTSFDTADIKETIFHTKIGAFSEYLYSIKQSPQFTSYLDNPKSGTNNTELLTLFSTLAQSNHNIMQVRYLDALGLEKIRVDRDFKSGEITQVLDNNLQNKVKRDYFIETSKLAMDKTWYSNIDLNMEHGKIEIPYKPVLRIANPIYHNNVFSGIVIINIHMESILDSITASAIFNIYLVDSDGYFLIHRDKDNFNWSRYVQNSHTLKEHAPKYADKIIVSNEVKGEYFYAKKLFTAGSQTSVYLLIEPKEETIDKFLSTQRKVLYIEASIIILFSIIIGYFLSLISYRLNKELIHTKEVLEHEMELIDGSVFISMTDLEGRITHVSKAFEVLTGYSEEDVVGKTHNMLRHPSVPDSFYQQMWETISVGKTWHGNIKNITKKGDVIWVKVHIVPDYNEKAEMIGFISFREDVTDKKHIEEIATKDEMSGLYNRRFYKEIIKKEINRAKRANSNITYMMIDIDVFKQYNDTYGHQEGDNVIKQVSNAIQKSLMRGSDYAFRMGGEEFLVLIFNEDTANSKKLAERIRSNIEALKIPHIENRASEYVTISIGIVVANPQTNSINEADLYKQSDEALYCAKQQGRNRVAVYKYDV